MDAGTLFYTIISVVGTILLGVIGFFLKREMTRGDRVEQDVKLLDVTKADKEDVEKLESSVTKIKEDYITKEDFYREQAKTDRKLDRIIDILLERKGQSNG
ncbi:MAG: hypothetical protein EOM54_11345 [Clostridia bacterium]|nr:hypothetical protein [Clostridia bacterium]